MHVPVFLSQASESVVSMLLLHWHGWQAPPTSSGLPKKPDAHSSHRLPVRTNRHGGNYHHSLLVHSPINSKTEARQQRLLMRGILIGSCSKQWAALGETVAARCSIDGNTRGTKAWHCSQLPARLSPQFCCCPVHLCRTRVMLPGMRFMVVPASPAQFVLPSHIPSAASLHQQHTGAGAAVHPTTCTNTPPSHQEV